MNININGIFYDLSSPKIMGILNVTPDSFYDGGKFNTIKEILIHVEKMTNEGMDILDIGGYSSRPGAKKISVNEELSRVIPVLKEIKYNFKELIISIDTYKSIVAERTLDLGANIINDISAGNLDDNMLKVVSDFNYRSWIWFWKVIRS